MTDFTALSQALRTEANRLGFSLFGIAPATEADTHARFVDWLEAGYHGEMAYLANRREARRHPQSILESVRSVVMLGYEYDPPENHGPVRIAAYACGPDYHDLLWGKLKQLGEFLQQFVPEARTRGVTDTAPLLERDFARRAGLGWFGKNTMLINKHRGSFFLLAGLLTNLVLPTDQPHTTSHCGRCTACLEACPTQAFVSAGTLDARRCISYWTIETKTSIPLELRPSIGNWLFGCDICQEVCPWNRHAAERDPPFPTDSSLATISAVDILRMSQEEFRRRFKATPLFRPRWNGLRRNAAIVLGNIGGAEVLPALEQASRDEDEFVREAATWACTQIRNRIV